ncbi:M20 family metallopeptidase [uncultured Gimesia sp.]|mgnify:CR=1 FL=1|jgi:succinyl-diaminopimelate desuccinylase|uniref:M20 family metallopeptidase n=1 Tax=uncultured Gimesia sp. TaxID=1678688 RepID=UPI00261F9894|nr:M20 family metallopeptidase [uncultured Gimesia sp.]
MDAVRLLKQIISIPSVNPMGRAVSGDIYFEGKLTQFLCDYFAELGVEYESIEVVPGRNNVIARTRVKPGAPTILMDVHQDTVPAEGMIVPAFEGTEKDGKIYGRGACDVKGGMAAMLMAFTRLVQDNPPDAANVILSCTCDEEATVKGIEHLVQLWENPSGLSQILTEPPDLGLVAEPTMLDIVVAHRGATRWKIKTTGKACHSSQPKDGINAIYRMADVIKALEAYAEELSQMEAHPLCGPPTLSVGVIEGGDSVNIVPDWCTIEIDRRVIPGEDGIVVMNQVEEYLKQKLPFDFEMLPPWITGVSLSDHNNGEWSDRLLSVIDTVEPGHKKVGVPYGTHAARVNQGGVPAMVFGPGSIAQAHTFDEWIEIDQLLKAEEVYYQFCATAGRIES